MNKLLIVFLCISYIYILKNEFYAKKDKKSTTKISSISRGDQTNGFTVIK